MRLLLKIYKNSLSLIIKFLFPSGGCKFKTTCSEYTVEVIEKYGIIKGVLMAFRRIISCR